MSDPRVDSLSMRRNAFDSPGAASCGAAPRSDSQPRRSPASSHTGRVSAAPRAAAFIQQRQLNTLAATYFVPEGQDFFTKMAQDWGSQNGVTVATDYIGWPDLQPRIAAAVGGGSGADIIEMWDTWPYLYYENMVPVDDLAADGGQEYGGFYDWVINTASVDGKWYSVPMGTRAPRSPIASASSRKRASGSQEQFPQDLRRTVRARQEAERDGQAVRTSARAEPGRPAELCLSLHVELRRDGGGGGRDHRRHQQAGVRRSAAEVHPGLEGRLRRDRAIVGRRRQQSRLPLRSDLRHAQRQQRLSRRGGGQEGRIETRLRGAGRARRHLARRLSGRAGRAFQCPRQSLLSPR